MLEYIIIYLILGLIAGTITGLIPGIHINLIGTILVYLVSRYFWNLNEAYLITFIISMAITHTFLDFIPSILLGCPDTDTELSVLPGHQMLKDGEAYEAILLTAYGSLAAVILFVLIALPSTLITSIIYDEIKDSIHIILIIVIMTLVLSERNRFQSLLVILLTGSLGLIALNIESVSQPLLPMLTGLFGTSMLLKSIKNKPIIPPQIIKKPPIYIKPLLGSLFAAPLCSFLPGLGSGQAAVIGNIVSKTDKKGFLTLLGATNTLVMGFSFISIYTISKARTGAAAAIQDIVPELTTKHLVLMVTITLISGVLAFFLTINIAKIFSLGIGKINYTIASSVTLLIIISIVALISGKIGLLILLTSTIVGLYCIEFDVRRTNMMGCLMIPVISYYLF